MEGRVDRRHVRRTLLKCPKCGFTYELSESHSSKQTRYFHKLRDRLAEKRGYDKEAIKAELKRSYGATDPIHKDIKEYREGRPFITWDAEPMLLVSCKEYSTHEMSALITGTLDRCMTEMVDIEDLMRTYG